MSRPLFAGSAGLLDVPAPEWIEADEGLFSYWGLCLMTLIRHGRIVTVKPGCNLDLAAGQLGLLIEGGLYALDEGTLDDRALFVSFLRRGDIFKAMGGPASPLTFLAHTRSSVLVLDEASLQTFIAEFAIAERVLHALEVHLTCQYAGAAQTVGWKDLARVRRAIQMLADHPTATDTKLGREIESSKQNIRRLAGVQKRSASRAFNALAQAGEVTFYGYKRIFYRGEPDGTAA